MIIKMNYLRNNKTKNNLSANLLIKLKKSLTKVVTQMISKKTMIYFSNKNRITVLGILFQLLIKNELFNSKVIQPFEMYNITK